MEAASSHRWLLSLLCRSFSALCNLLFHFLGCFLCCWILFRKLLPLPLSSCVLHSFKASCLVLGSLIHFEIMDRGYRPSFTRTGADPLQSDMSIKSHELRIHRQMVPEGSWFASIFGEDTGQLVLLTLNSPWNPTVAAVGSMLWESRLLVWLMSY